jgi:Na+-driven multidrug efflux pump
VASTWPGAWIGAFSDDPHVLATGATYLRTVGLMFCFFGIGYALYCAGQGTGQMEWPVAGACLRAALAILGGALAYILGQDRNGSSLRLASGWQISAAWLCRD